MFTIKSYKLFEGSTWFTDTDIEFCESILSRKSEIESDFDISVEHRQPFGDTVSKNTGSKFIDLYKISTNGIRTSFGVYNLSTKEFILFYEGETPLNRESYIHITSENFFDGLEKVYYKTFLDIN